MKTDSSQKGPYLSVSEERVFLRVFRDPVRKYSVSHRPKKGKVPT